MTPIMIAALMECYYLSYPTDNDVSSPETLKLLINQQLIKRVERHSSVGVSYHYEVIERGKIMVEKLCSIPLPQAKMTWIFPDEG